MSTSTSQNQSTADIINTILVKLQFGLSQLQDNFSHVELNQIMDNVSKLYLDLSCHCLPQTDGLSSQQVQTCLGIISSYLTTHVELMSNQELSEFHLATKFLHSDFDHLFTNETVFRAAKENRPCKFSYAKINISQVEDKTNLYYCLRFSKLNYLIHKGFIVIAAPDWSDTEFLNILKWQLRNFPDATIEIVPRRGKKKLGADELFIKSHS